MKFSVLCYDAKDELVMATTSKDIETSDLVDVLGTDYRVTEAGTLMTTMGYSSKVIYLEKYKELKKKVG